MQEYEIIFVVKEAVLSHYNASNQVSSPTYRIRRDQIEAENEVSALQRAREIKEKSIDDCLTDSRILSVSTRKGLEPQKYKEF